MFSSLFVLFSKCIKCWNVSIHGYFTTYMNLHNVPEVCSVLDASLWIDHITYWIGLNVFEKFITDENFLMLSFFSANQLENLLYCSGAAEGLQPSTDDVINHLHRSCEVFEGECKEGSNHQESTSHAFILLMYEGSKSL